MFPTAGAIVFRNEAGEPTGWDVPSFDPPEPDDLAPEPYRSDEVIDLFLAVDADAFTADIAAQVADGYSAITLPGPIRRETMRAIGQGASDLVIHTTDGSVWLGEVSDYDTGRASVTVDLR